MALGVWMATLSYLEGKFNATLGSIHLALQEGKDHGGEQEIKIRD